MPNGHNTFRNVINRGNVGDFAGDTPRWHGVAGQRAQPSALAAMFHNSGQSGYFNPSPFYRGIDNQTAYETRKKAKRIFAPAMGAIVAQDALLGPTLALAGRTAAGYGDIYRTEAAKARAFETGQLEEFGPRVSEAFSRFNPESSALLSLLTQDATGLVQGGSNAYEDHELTQAIRGAQAARGLGYGTGDAIGEVVGLDRGRESRRIARGSYGAGIVDLGRQYYSPALSILGLGPQGADIQAPGVGTGTDDLLSISINDTMSRRNQQSARRSSNMALAGSFLEGLGSAVGGAAACWVAEVLYGKRDVRTHLARAWCAANQGHPFVKAYTRAGRVWATWLQQNLWAKPFWKPIWDAMWRAQLEA